MFSEIAVDIPLFDALTYRVPPELVGVIKAGQLVQVPFRNRSKTGVVLRLSETLKNPELAAKIRDIVDVVDPEPLMTSTGIRFLEFVAEYYFSPVGEVTRLAIPSAVRVEGIKHYQASADPAPWDDLPDGLRAALEECRESAVSVRSIREKFGVPYAKLSELERLGLVEVTYVDDTQVRAKTEKVYRRTSIERPTRLGPKQRVLLDLIESSPEIPLAQIRELVANPHSSLKSLVERELVEVREDEVYRDPFRDADVREPQAVELSAGQRGAVDAIEHALDSQKFAGFVLHGVTGSGKTEVYVHAIRHALEMGRTAVVLLPEIALTPQFVSVFRGHFGDEELAVLHSGLSVAEKFDQWRRIQRGEVSIVIGARSAIFAPIASLGIIVVDEEHDTSFKQEEGPRYNARDLALMRGKLEGAAVVLGSATPSLESIQNTKTGRLKYLSMPNRVSDRSLPHVELVDIRGRGRSDGLESAIANELRTSMESGFDSGQQTILFLNRRGYSPCVICDECGHRWMCPNCDVSLTYHRRQESLRCHHCDYSIRLPELCPECGEMGVGPRGIGTEKLEELLTLAYEERQVGRLDRDTGSGGGLQRVIRSFSTGETDVLVGTQMVTKGHDFPGVTTVGVVLADQSLNFPDFRSSERTFQLMTQVAGRAGRGDESGNVFIQTYNPNHYSLVYAVAHDFEAFVERELMIRQEMRYPPFSHLIAIKFEARSDGAVVQAARDYAFSARRIARQAGLDHVLIVGPALSPFERLRGRTRYQVLLRSEDRTAVRKLTHQMLSAMEYFDLNRRRHKNVRIVVDVDPQNLL